MGDILRYLALVIDDGLLKGSCVIGNADFEGLR